MRKRNGNRRLNVKLTVSSDYLRSAQQPLASQPPWPPQPSSRNPPRAPASSEALWYKFLYQIWSLLRCQHQTSHVRNVALGLETPFSGKRCDLNPPLKKTQLKLALHCCRSRQRAGAVNNANASAGLADKHDAVVCAAAFNENFVVLSNSYSNVIAYH